MNKPKFDKPALSADRLAELFLYRGLTGISSEELAHKLKFLNYYRLRGYTYPYQNNGCEDAPFITGTCWNDIWSDYCFDQNLRMMIFDAMECLNNKPFIQFFPSQLDFQSNRVVMFHVFGLKLLSGASKTAPKAALEALE